MHNQEETKQEEDLKHALIDETVIDDNLLKPVFKQELPDELETVKAGKKQISTTETDKHKPD